MLVHDDWKHVMPNVGVQLILAGLSMFQHHGFFGQLEVLTTYLVGGFCGALEFILYDDAAKLVGCSAGVSALLGLNLVDTGVDLVQWVKSRKRLVLDNGKTFDNERKIVLAARILVFVALIGGELNQWRSSPGYADILRIHFAGFVGGVTVTLLFLVSRLCTENYCLGTMKNERDDEEEDEEPGRDVEMVPMALKMSEASDLLQLPSEHRTLYRQISNIYQ